MPADRAPGRGRPGRMYCVACGFEPANASQALAHSGQGGWGPGPLDGHSIVKDIQQATPETCDCPTIPCRHFA